MFARSMTIFDVCKVWSLVAVLLGLAVFSSSFSSSSSSSSSPSSSSTSFFGFADADADDVLVVGDFEGGGEDGVSLLLSSAFMISISFLNTFIASPILA